ncbi:MAG: PAS domain-containing sensor histidine kinase [Coleofasciculaceae cyanobacterium]
MNPLVKKLLTPRYEYLTLDRNLIILEASYGAQYFAEFPDELYQGNDVRLSFPEIIGIESVLIDILEGREVIFELKGVGRSEERNSKLLEQCQNTNNTLHYKQYPLYIDLYINESSEQNYPENSLIILLEDSTERMLLQQSFAQRTNEAQLLLTSTHNSKNYIDKIITSMAEALIVTTNSGIIKTANQFAQDLFGYSEEELVNKPISLIICDENFLNQINSLSNYGVGEFLKNVEINCLKKNQENITVAFSCSAVPTEIQGLKNFVYIGRDISERKQLEAEMSKALNQERELRELKSDFISIASHEFRTPLTSILSSTELLEKYSSRWTQEKKQKHYRRIESSVKRMTELVDDVLLISKVEAGKLEFNPQPLIIQSFCETFVEEIQLSIDRENRIDFTYSGQVAPVYLDEKLLIQILNNLLTNALKYSPQETIVRFRCTCQQYDVIFEIQDQGIGIPLEDQKRLFESFHRAKNVGDIPGTGLGLTIVQKSVNLHNGNVNFVSQVGVGTTFRVILPLTNSEDNET